jgi:hypothetical protein
MRTAISQHNFIFNTRFIDDLIKNQEILTENVRKRKGYLFGQNNHHLLTINEKRTLRIFTLISNLFTIINDLKLIYVLINKLPAKSYRKKHDISELDYIRLHYEVFIHKIHTVCELMKFIANEVLNIQLSHKDCNWANLIKNKEFNNSKCRKIIQEYYDDFKDLIESRHRNSHRGIYDDEKMDQVSAEYLIYSHENKFEAKISDEFKEMFPYFIVRYKVRKYKRHKLKEIAKYEQIIFKHVYNFLCSLVLE